MNCKKAAGAGFAALLIVLMANLSALVDAWFQPQLSYLTASHLITGGVSMIATAALLGLLQFASRCRRNLDRHEQLLQQLHETGDRHSDFLEKANDLIQILNPTGKFLYCNSAWRKTLGYEQHEIQDLTIFDVLHPDCLDHCTSMFQRVLAGENLEGVEVTFLSKQGQKVFAEGSANCRFENNTPVSTRGIFRDVTHRKKTEADLLATTKELQRVNQILREQTIRDGLTKLYNHRHFQEILRRDFLLARRHDSDLACLMLDLDRFKKVNDTYGHLFGDQVMQTVAKLLKGLARKTDSLARYGGEEFTILLPNTDLEGARAIAERIRSRIAEFEHSDGTQVTRITTSIGVASLKAHHPNHPEQLLEFADRALYLAKTEGRNRVMVFPSAGENNRPGSPANARTPLQLLTKAD